MHLPDERARHWTRAEDYWPPVRLVRRVREGERKRLRAARERSDPLAEPRRGLTIIPFALLMLGLAVLSVAIIVTAWPGRRDPSPAATQPVARDIGTAAPGWIDGR